MGLFKPIRDLSFKEEVDVLHSLLSSINGITRQHVVNILSVTYFTDVISYMDNIGIIMSYTDDDISLHVSTLGNDIQWGEAKVQMLYDHLYNKAIGGK